MKKENKLIDLNFKTRMSKNKKTYIPSKSSPKGGKRGCLCKNGKYSAKCCNGDLQAQGIGNV